MTDNPSLLALLKTCRQDYLYRQLAEECAELTQAALKRVRYISQELPKEARYSVFSNYLEELADVGVMWSLAVDALPEHERQDMQTIMRCKRERMAERLGDRAAELRQKNKYI